MFSNVSNASLWFAAQAQTQVYASPNLETAQRCIPSNPLFTKLIAAPIRQMEGGVGALLPIAVGAVTIVIGLIAIFMVVTKKGAKWLKMLVMPFAALLVVIGILLVGGTIYMLLNSHCTTPFG